MRETNIVIVYDSVYGNTGKIAMAIAEGMSGHIDVKVVKADEAGGVYLRSVSVLIVGSPTHGGRPTPNIQEFLEGVKDTDGEGTHFAAFDTRFSYRDQNIGLRFLMRMIGYAAEKIDDKLTGLGGSRLLNSEGFIVEDREGPLRKGELERAKKWGADILNEYEERYQEEMAAVLD